MSSRQLRKLRQQQELLSLQKENTERDAESGTEEDEEPVARPSKPKFSGFAALAGNDDENEDMNDVSDSEPAESATPASEESIPVKTGKKSKKKKKKAKKPGAVSQEGPVPGGDHDLDEIDRAIKELNLAKEESTAKTATEDSTCLGPGLAGRLSQLLRINFQHLKVLNEMRRLFGKEAMETAEHEEDNHTNVTHGRRQRQPRQQNVDLETFLRGQPGKGITEVVRRRNPFIEGKSTWPRATAGGLTMAKIRDGGDGEVEFAFVHDKAYGQLETQFFFLVGMYDPQKLIFFLHQAPYHVSTLIQVSRIAHQDQNAALAAELCERALFTFGRVTLSSFRKKLEEGKARLNFMRPENRQFWLAGYHYIKNLIRKGTYRTALEWAKLFLSIDQADPYGMLNWIHVLAIRSHEAQWFIDVCNTDLLETEARSFPNDKYVRQTMVLAKLQLGDREGAKMALCAGMQVVRWLYTKLFGALDIDVPPSLWGVMAPNQTEQLSTDLYIHLAADLWNSAETKDLLREVGSTLGAPGDDEITRVSYLTTSDPDVALSTARFVYLEGKTDLMSGVPRDMLHATPNFDFDPLPPAREDNIFSDEKQMLPWTSSPRDGDLAPPDIRDILNQGMQQEIPAHELEQMEALFTDPTVAEETRGWLRRFLDMVGTGALGPRPAEMDRLEMPGAFVGSSDEEDEGDDDDDGWGDDIDDMVDDFGDQHDDEDSLPDLIPYDPADDFL